MARAESRGAVHLFGRFVDHRAAAQLRSRISAVKLDHQLAARDAGIRRAAGIDGVPFPRRIEKKFRFFIHTVFQDIKSDLFGPVADFETVAFDKTVIDRIGHQHLGDTTGLARFDVVIDGHLPFSIRRKDRILTVFKGPHQLVDQNIGQRKHFRRFIAGKTVHDALVPRADLPVFV